MTTDLDELLRATGGFTPAAAEAETVIGKRPRPCIHPRDRRVGLEGGGYRCDRCQRVITIDQVRRGRRSRRLGGDTERRIEKVYGPRKVGEYGDPVDHVGRIWRWQSKATRQLPPKWLAIIDAPTYRGSIPFALAAPHVRMADYYAPRVSVVIRSFVRAGGKAEGRTRDWLVIHAESADQLGLEAVAAGWYIIPGDWWLDHFGRDE